MALSSTESHARRAGRSSQSAMAEKREVLGEADLNRMIAIERKRTERSNQPFLLMLLEADAHRSSSKNPSALDSIVSSLLKSIRDTDVIGWYKERETIGVIYTGFALDSGNSVMSMILSRVSLTLGEALTSDQFGQVSISLHYFPDDWEDGGSGRPSNPALYPDLTSSSDQRRSVAIVKRAIDLCGSAFLLVLSAPLLVVIAIAIKASSTGPVLFRQLRVGQHGKLFTFYKFRSMHANNDSNVHREYVTKFITSRASKQRSTADGESVYKLANDARVTRIGKLLRRSSLDELPQFLNVLKGEMSLVGPRPPLPYELKSYQIWHRRRVLDVKPGITGLWQVTGRSRVSFDEMVRLDLHYATFWSPFVDLSILARTPLAVIKGSGAV